MKKNEFEQKISEAILALKEVKGVIDLYGGQSFQKGEYENVDVARNYTKSFVGMIDDLEKLKDKLTDKIYGK